MYCANDLATTADNSHKSKVPQKADWQGNHQKMWKVAALFVIMPRHNLIIGNILYGTNKVKIHPWGMAAIERIIFSKKLLFK